VIGRVGWAFAALVAGAGITMLSVPSRAGVIISATVLVALGLGLLVLVVVAREMTGRGPSEFEQVLERPPGKSGRPPDLLRLERSLGWERYEARDFNVRVRPRLRALLEWRIKEVWGFDLDAQPEIKDKLPAELSDLALPRPSLGETGLPLRTQDIARIVDRIVEIR
jgi:hypothetical protein